MVSNFFYYLICTTYMEIPFVGETVFNILVFVSWTQHISQEKKKRYLFFINDIIYLYAQIIVIVW